ncbi:MAG TPA: CsgG/HfaB family protein [Planctomycetota bacterium]
MPESQRLVLAIAGMDSKETLGGPRLSAAALEYLQDRLVSCGRFRVVERMQLRRILEEQQPEGTSKAAKLAGADWVVYGAITEASLRGGSGPGDLKGVAEALVHLRVVRVEDGVIIYSHRHRGSAVNTSSSMDDSLLFQAVRAAVDKLAGEIAELAP